MIDIYPRAYTAEEARYQFLELVRQRCDWWAAETRCQSEKDRCYGVAHSILSIIDGCAIDYPIIDLIVRSNPEDQEYFIEQGENWYPQELDILNTGNHSTLGYELYNWTTPPPPPPISEMILAEPLELTVSYHFPELEDE